MSQTSRSQTPSPKTFKLRLKDLNRTYVGDTTIDLENAPSQIVIHCDQDAIDRFKFKHFDVLANDQRPSSSLERDEDPHEVEDAAHISVATLEEPQGISIPLHMRAALGDPGANKETFIHKCPTCKCRDLYTRRDFPQKLGLSIVVIAAIAATIISFKYGFFVAAAVLFSVVILDLIAHFFAGECVVCYRCRSEFRDIKMEEPEGFELATAEKYRS